MAVTIDDLPIAGGGNRLSAKEQKAMFYRILNALDKHNVRVYGFVIGKNVNDKNKKLLSEFIKRGHTPGNHTYSHPDFNKTTVGEYIKDIEKGRKVLNKINVKGKFFRYPYLRRGNTRQKRDALYAYLDGKGYTIVPISIDNGDWAYSNRYERYKKYGQKKMVKKIGNEYIAHMLKYVRRFDKLGRKKTGRNVRHILLLHMNFINSIYLDRLLTQLKKRGWEFITVEEAMKDPVYKRKDVYVGGRGKSYLERIK